MLYTNMSKNKYKVFIVSLCTRKVYHKVIIIYFLLFLFFILKYYVYNDKLKFDTSISRAEEVSNEFKLSITSQDNLIHNLTVEKYYEKRKNWKTSNLGSLLFKNTDVTYGRSNRTFNVLIWKYWNWLKGRHILSFNGSRHDPLDECSVNNCVFLQDDEDIDTADAVVVHIQHGVIPVVRERDPRQIWIFLTDEAPKNTFSMAKQKPKLSDWANIFNWSMTYRSDADIPVPYGRTVPLPKQLLNDKPFESIAELVPNWKKKQRDVLVTVLMSNCGVSYRMEYLKKLQRYIDIDVYGKCSDNNKKRCPGHFKADCDVVTEYLFYLVLENSQCRQYLTEKSFHNAYSKGAIPIILGPPAEDCEDLLPPDSYIHVDDYESTEELAKFLISISKSDKMLLTYHQWRNDFKVLNEHGYFGTKSFHLCRICEGLNFNSREHSVYDEDNLRMFLDTKLTCK